MPIAGCSHWRREPEFAAAQAAAGLDLIDDRLYWAPATFIAPEMKSQLWSHDGGLASAARRKRHAGPAYVVGPVVSPDQGGLGLARTRRPTSSWPPPRPCTRTGTPWSGGASSCSPWNGAQGRRARWEAKTSSRSPRSPTAARTSTPSGRTWPRSCSAGATAKAEPERETARPSRGRIRPAKRRPRTAGAPGWDPARGRLVIDTPFTQGIAGWFGGEPVGFPQPGCVGRQPVRGGRGQLGRPGADRHDQAAARHAWSAAWSRPASAGSIGLAARSPTPAGRRSSRSRSSPASPGGAREDPGATC